MRNLAVLGLLIAFVGCPSAELKQLVRDQAASSAADYHDQKAGKLSKEQIDLKFYDDAASWAAANYNLNGVPVPPEFAPVTSGGAK